MATSACSDGDDMNTEWPLTYVRETKETICGWCGQVLVSNGTTVDLELHFERCKNSKENGLLMVFKELRKIKQKFDGLNAKVEEMKSEVRKVTEDNKQILDLNAEIKNELQMISEEVKNGALPTLSNRIEVLKEETKMAKVNGNHSEFEEKGASSAETNEAVQSETEEALSAQLRECEREIQSLKSQLEEERSERTKQLAIKKKSYHEEPSRFDELWHPMDCFYLATQNKLFQPSFRFNIGGIRHIMRHETYEMTDVVFHWNGYPVQARPTLRVIENGDVHFSLFLHDISKDELEPKEFAPIPQVFYLLRDRNGSNPKHKCECQYYASGTEFNDSLTFDVRFGHKSWLNGSTYKANDSVEVEIYVEPSRPAQLARSYDGTLESSFDSYKRRLRLEKEGLVMYQESPYFYTGPKGFRVQVRMYLNGSEDGKEPTARILFLTGKFDAELPQAFLHSTSVTLINRKDPRRSTTKTVVEDIGNKKEYEFEICKFEEMENVIENNTLYFKVIINSLQH